MPTPSRPWIRFAAVLAIVGACVVASTMPSGAASTNVIVTMDIVSTTSIGGACASGSPGVTAFGTVLPGTSAVTTADCVVTFGSSNDTSQLRAWQTDRLGRAAWAPPTGVLDTDTGDGDHFSTDGIHVVDPSAAVNDKGYELATQTNGDVIVLGYQSNGDHDLIVSRITAAGTTDTTFGGGGTGSRLMAVDTTYDDDPQAIAVYPDDRILVGGVVFDGAAEEDTVLARLLANGTPDPSWGGGTGIIRSDFGGAGFDDETEDVVIDSQGKVTMLIEMSNGGTCALVRVGENGAPDPSFHGDGISELLDHADPYQCESLVVDDQNRFVVGGERPTGDMMAARWLPDGSLDPAFGTGGVVGVVSAAIEDVNAVAALPDGSVAIAGSREASGQRDSMVTKFTSSGVLDAAFGPGGTRVAAYHATAIDELYAIHAMPDGSLLATGYTTDPVGGDFDPVMLKLRGDAAGTPDSTFGSTSNGRIMVDTALVDEIWDGEMWADGKVMLVGEASGSPAAMSVVRVDSVSLTDFVNGSSDWSVGTTSMFGACLASVANGASAGAGVGAWTAAGTCSMAASAPWRGIAPRSGAAGAKVAAATGVPTTSAEVRLRFGVRVATGQRPGTYYAPITFETLAPNT